MHRESQTQWINEVLNEVFLAVITSEPLRNALIFKGARILNVYLGESRQSLDIDSNMAPEMVASSPDIHSQGKFLEEHLPQALRRHFENQNPVNFELGQVKVEHKPAKEHPHGWNAFLLRIEVQDNRLSGVLGLPKLEIDVAAPELLGPEAVQTLEIQGIHAKVYALHRIAGEKLRAYLTSLPAYRNKMRGGERTFRVKDLHDIARILRVHPISDASFWAKAGQEFRLACQSRIVDCQGIETFTESWPQARERYERDVSLQAVPFPEAEESLRTVVGLFQAKGVFPLKFPDSTVL